MSDRIGPMLQRWSRQQLRALEGVRRWADGDTHEDGFSDISVSAFAREGGSTGGSGVTNQHFEEVFTGDSLLIWRILRDAPDEVREIAFAHYVASGDSNKKARALHISRTEYWERIKCSHYYIGGRLDESERKEALSRKRRPDSETMRIPPTDS